MLLSHRLLIVIAASAGPWAALSAADAGGAPAPAAAGGAPGTNPGPGPGPVQDADTQPPSTIIVTADRQSESIDATTASVDVVDQGRMREEGYALNAPDYLSSLPGVDVLDTGGGIDGGLQEVRLRGSSAQSDTAILLDGIPLNDVTAVNGSPDLSLLTLPGLQSIEVVRGSQSGLYGTHAVGGVIDFLTARPTSENHADGELEIGSFDTRRIQGWASGPLISGSGGSVAAGAAPPLGFSVGVDGIDSHGIAAQTTSPNGSPSGVPPDGVRKLGGNARIEAHPDDLAMLYVSGLYSNVYQAYSGYSAPAEPDYHRQELWRVGAGGSVGDANDAQLAVDYAHTRSIRNEVSISNGDSSYAGDDDFLGAQARAKPIPELGLTLGGDGDHQQSVTTSVSDHHEDLAGGYLRAALDLGALDLGGLALDGVVRHDEVTGDSAASTYRLGLAWWPLGTHIRVHAATGTAFTAPTLDERYGIYPFGATVFAGNPDLEPQTSRSWEAGVDLKPSSVLLLGSTAFSTIYHRRIVAVFDDLGNGTLVNESSDSSVRGLENELAWDDPQLPFAMHLSATWQRTRDDSGNRFALLPSRKASGDIVLRDARTWLLVGADAFSGRAASDGSSMAGYATVHAAVGWVVTRVFTLYVRGENLLNRGWTADQYSGYDANFNPEEFYYTSTPRSVFGGVEGRF